MALTRRLTRAITLCFAASGIAFLAGCAGVGSPYSTPASSRQIPFTVDPITPELVRELAVQPELDRALSNRPPELSSGVRDANGAYVYRIGSGDVLSIFINQPLYGERAGSSTQATDAGSLYVVSEGGDIFLPLHGPLRVAGMTIGQAYESIRAALSQFISRPQFNVRVADFRSQRVAVAGAVNTPGYFPITDRPMTVTEAVLLAGASETADLRRVVLKRAGRDYPVDVAALNRNPNFGSEWLLQNGDVLMVPVNENKVYVLGEAPNRTQLIDPLNNSLAEILLSSGSAAGGSNNYLQNGAALPGSVFVIRGNTEGARVFHLNASSPEAFILANEMRLAGGDLVYVSTRPVTRYNRFIAQLLPSLQSFLLPLVLVNQVDNLSN